MGLESNGIYIDVPFHMHTHLGGETITTTLKLHGATDSERLGHLSGVTQQAELEPRSSEPPSPALSIISKGFSLPPATSRDQVIERVKCGTLCLLFNLNPFPSISKFALLESNR